MKRKTWGVAVAAGIAIVVITGVVATAQQSPHVSQTPTTLSQAPKSLQISDVTATAATSHGESAIVMSLVNTTGGPISLMSVTSPSASMGMLFYDANMRQASSAMTWISDIVIGTAKTQLLGYQNQGVVLSLLHGNLKVGESVPLEIKYSNFSTSRTVDVNARVVPTPVGLHFNMSTMKM